MLQGEGYQSAQSQTYMKEYVCYDFAIHSNQSVSQSCSFSIKFRQSRSASTQPAAIVDTLQQINTLYLLQWVSTGRNNQQETLYVRELSENQWIRIDMNVQPQYVRISGEKLFLIGGRQLFIVDLAQKITEEKQIEDYEVIAINPCLVQIHNPKGSYFQSYFQGAISIIYFQQGLGYSRRNYSMNSSATTKNMFTSVTQIAKKFSNKNKQGKYLHFEVIIPNILALAFTSNSFKIYNLHDMQQSPFEGRLNFGTVELDKKPIVRWQRNEAKEQYNETLQILIGNGGFIEVFFVSFLYKNIPELKEQSLVDLVEGDLINWTNVDIYTFISLAIEGGFLVDMALSKKGVGYYSKDNEKSQIGYCRYTNIDLEALSAQIPILSQEAIVWRNYYEDKKIIEATQQLDPNRFYNPSRYLTSFIVDQPQDKICERELQILTNWRKTYSFKTMIVFKEDMLIVRSGSLSVSREISEKLYKFEHFTEEHLHQLEQMHISGETDDISMTHLFVEQTIDEYDEPLFYTEIDRPRQAQRKYLDQQDFEIKASAEQEAKNAFESFTNLIQSKFNKQVNSLKLEEFKEMLILGEIRDRLNYYSLAFNSKSFLIERAKQRQANKEYDMQSYITRCVDYFHGLSARSQIYIELFGSDLLSLFVQNHKQQTSKDIDYSVCFFFQKMFEFIIPKRTTNYQNSIIIDSVPFQQHYFSNSFIEFLVQKLIEVMDIAKKQSTTAILIDKEKVLREELRKIIGLGVLDYRELNFSQLRRNKSILKALLLSNLPEKLELHTSQYLVSADKGIEMFQQYVNLKPYMKMQDIRILQKCVLLNRLHRHTFKIKFDPSSFGYHNQYNLSDDLFALIQNNYLEYIDRQYWSSQTLYEQDNSSLISSLFKEIDDTTDQTLRDKLLVDLERAVQDCCINSNEKKLEYYELMLCGYVKLFNRTVDRQDCNSESDQFLSYRKKLCNFLNKIDDYFQSYKQIYYQFYEDVNEILQQSIHDQHSKEEELMNSVFLDQRPVLFLPKLFDGFVCTTFAINLLRMALFGQINGQNSSIRGIYQQCMSNSNDLTGHWIHKVLNLPEKEAMRQIAIYALILTNINTLGVVQISKILPEWRPFIDRVLTAFNHYVPSEDSGSEGMS